MSEVYKSTGIRVGGSAHQRAADTSTCCNTHPRPSGCRPWSSQQQHSCNIIKINNCNKVRIDLRLTTNVLLH